MDIEDFFLQSEFGFQLLSLHSRIYLIIQAHYFSNSHFNINNSTSNLKENTNNNFLNHFPLRKFRNSFSFMEVVFRLFSSFIKIFYESLINSLGKIFQEKILDIISKVHQNSS